MASYALSGWQNVLQDWINWISAFCKKQIIMYISSATLSFSLNGEQDVELHNHCTLLGDLVADPSVVDWVHLEGLVARPRKALCLSMRPVQRALVSSMAECIVVVAELLDD